jgi:hypothetical protein
MAHAQKPDLVFPRNGRVHLNRPVVGVSSVDYCAAGLRISGSNAGYTVFRGSVKGTGYPLQSPVSPLLFPRRVPSHFNWTLPKLRVVLLYTSHEYITILT